MSITLYTKDFVPLAVLDLDDVDVVMLNDIDYRHYFEFVDFSTVTPLYMARALDRVPAGKTYEAVIKTGRVQWMNGVTKWVLITDSEYLIEHLGKTFGTDQFGDGSVHRLVRNLTGLLKHRIHRTFNHQQRTA